MSSIEAGHTVSYGGGVSRDRLRSAMRMAVEWAYSGEKTKLIFPQGFGGRVAGDGPDRSQYAYWVIESAIGAWVRHMAGTPGYQRYWADRIRPLMVARFRDGKKLSDAEWRFVVAVLCESVRIDAERAKGFETE